MKITTSYRQRASLLKRIFLFGAVGGIGVIVNTLLLYFLTAFAGLHYIIASVIATEAAILSNFFNNNFITFRDRREGSAWKKLASFQLVSMTTIAGTAAILWMLAESFGEELLLVWNLIAIVAMFSANFALNSRITWAAKKVPARAAMLIAIALISAQTAAAEDIVAVSQLGYHPDAHKQVVVYTDAASGTMEIHDKATGQVKAQYTLQKATDFDGNDVQCQGGVPCLYSDFTGFKEEGNYYITANGISSPEFPISKDIYKNLVPVLLEFYNAMLQQNSDYHADMHSDYDPVFPAIADGSFIMESHQAADALIRLGSAYNRNPALFTQDSHDILAPGKPDIQEYILVYVDYLESLQGVVMEKRTDGTGFRIDASMKIQNAFVPGNTDLTSLDVYIPGSPPQLLETVPVTSLCGSMEGAEYSSCIADAALYYKCQADEPCLNLTYVEKTGAITGRSGYGIARGWGYEFGCFADMIFTEEIFTTSYDPCMIFYPSATRERTSHALLGFAEGFPAARDYSEERGNELLDRAIATHSYIKSSYAPYANGDDDAGFYGAALFLLFKHTGNSAYLSEAHALRNKISVTFIADSTNGNEFYWEEYVRNRQAIESAGLEYRYQNENPEEFFRGKIFFDYKDMGANAMSKTAERVFQFDSNIQFQNSRFMLTEALLAAKATELHPDPEGFIPETAVNQLAWVTGMNAVQDGVMIGSPLKSVSFIFGIGNFPEEFHSRYLIDTGNRAASSGKVVGARGTNLQFLNGSQYIFLDGRHEILGKELGSPGNGWRGESKAKLYNIGKSFANGKKYIAGWINGAFDINSNPAETDVIFNYDDNTNTYQFTESTNEIVGTAIELAAYLDAQYNSANPPVQPPPPPPPPPPLPPAATTANLTVATQPEAQVFLNGTLKGSSDNAGNFMAEVEKGSYFLLVTKQSYKPYNTTISIIANTTANAQLIPVPKLNSVLIFTSSWPSHVYFGGAYKGLTNATGYMEIKAANGTYNLVVSSTKPYYGQHSETVTVNSDMFLNITLPFINSTGNSTNGTIPDNSTNTTPPINPPPNNSSNSTPPGNNTNNTAPPGNSSSPSPQAKITSSSTNLSQQSSTYHMFETETAKFTVTTDKNGTVTWKADDETIASTMGTSHTLKWSPGLLFTSNVKPVKITASSNGSVAWDVVVEYVINPFFTGIDGANDTIGSAETEIHVFTNDKAANFSNLSAVIWNEYSGTSTTYLLSPYDTGNSEIDWRRALTNAPYGNSYISFVTGYINGNESIVTYDFGTARAHYRTIPGGGGAASGSSNDDDDDKYVGAAGGGGGGGGGIVVKPELVYAIFGKDVVAVNGTQNLTLDAKTKQGDIQSVEARILTPIGTVQNVQMALVKGSQSYGTWQANLSNFVAGRYVLKWVKISPKLGNPVTVEVNGTSFYAVSAKVSEKEELELVYYVLNESTVKNGSIVMLTVDARDSKGISSIKAEGETSRGEHFEVQLSLQKGNKNYGTWAGNITAETPDTTYDLHNITLSAADSSRTYSINDRSFYVEAIPYTPKKQASLTPAGKAWEWSFDRLRKLPLLPTAAGFILMATAATMILVGGKLGGKIRQWRSSRQIR